MKSSLLTVRFALRLLIIGIVCAFSLVPSFLLRWISIKSWFLIFLSIAASSTFVEIYTRYRGGFILSESSKPQKLVGGSANKERNVKSQIV